MTCGCGRPCGCGAEDPCVCGPVCPQCAPTGVDAEGGEMSAESLRGPLCALCRRPVGAFRDDLSAREFRISGCCQRCQDEVFAAPEDMDGDDACPHCGSHVCFEAVIPGPITCG